MLHVILLGEFAFSVKLFKDTAVFILITNYAKNSRTNPAVLLWTSRGSWFYIKHVNIWKPNVVK